MQELIDAIESRAWYPVAAILITMVIGLWRKVQPSVWERIPKRLQWIPAAVLAGLSAFAEAFAQGEGWKVALGLSVYALIAGALPAIGAVHVTKRATGSVNTKGVAATTMVLLILLASGCAGTFEEARLVAPEQPIAAARDSGRCVSLDNTRIVWGAVGKGSAVVAGGSGLATIPAESRELEVGLAIGSVSAAALAATAVYVSESAGESYVRECVE